MDTITHGIVGALAGKALFGGRDVQAFSRDRTLSTAESSPSARAAIVACTIGSIFPDVDIIVGDLARNPLAIMEWHRNITHSLVMLPIWAALLAGVSLPLAKWLRWKAPSFPRLFVIYAIGLGTHVFLDVITSFGTMVWSPVTYTRVAWDWLFILDLTLTSLALVPQLAAWCYRDPQKFRRRGPVVWALLTMGAFGGYALAASAGYAFAMTVVAIASFLFAVVLFAPAMRRAGFAWRRASWCRVGLVLVCAYLTLASDMHGKALAEVNHFAAAHQLTREHLAAIPLPPTVTQWAGLVATPEGVWRTTFREPGDIIERTQFYSDEQSNRFVEKAKTLHDVQVYLWFARFPIWQVTKRGERTTVDVTDVRFFREEDPTAEAASDKREHTGVSPNPPGFTFEVVFDTEGHIVSSGFKRPQP